MKKCNLVALSVLAVLCLSACSNGVDHVEKIVVANEGNDIVSTELPEVVEVNSEEENESCTFSQESYDSVKAYFEGYSYISLVQTMENGYKDESASTSITYSVTADTASKITDFVIKSTDTEGVESSKHYLRDFANDITFERNAEDTAWVECDGTIMMIDWDLETFDSVFSVWQYVMKDHETPIGAEGYISGDYEYYSTSKKADKTMISGVEYDKLGNQELTYIYQRLGGSLVPVSVIADVNYFIGDKEYYVRSTIQVGTVNDTQLSMPDLEE